MPHRVLHLLSQRPGLTGSGVSLQAIVGCAARAGWEQHVVIGVPADDPTPAVGELPRERIHPLVFGRGRLDFPLPGMSDVMPYPSSRWSDLNATQLQTYREAWRERLTEVIDACRPDVIHARHIWLLSSLVKDVAPSIPVVNHCHATGLRQMELCPHLSEEVQRGCARNDRFLVLHQDHAEALQSKLGVAPERIHIVGAGYQEDIFHPHGRRRPDGTRLLYAGKYSYAKGLPQLLDAVERLGKRRADLTLHVAGEGAGAEADGLRDRMKRLAPRVVLHGQLGQADLAELMRQCDVFVLPSFYEGLPLVLVEALACGCRAVCSDLPGVRAGLYPHLEDWLRLVPLPRLLGPDVPVAEDLPGFVEALADRLAAALDEAAARSERVQTCGAGLEGASGTHPTGLDNFTWQAVFERIEAVWRELVA